MEEIAGIVLRLVFIYIYLLVLVRLAGKRSVGEATPLDFIVALIISDFPDDVIWGEVPVANGVVALGAIALLHVLVAVLSYRNRAISDLVESLPSPLLVQGELQQPNMARERINEANLDAMLRLQGIDKRKQVEAGTLELNGHFSVIRQEPFQPAQKQEQPQLEEALQ